MNPVDACMSLAAGARMRGFSPLMHWSAVLLRNRTMPFLLRCSLLGECMCIWCHNRRGSPAPIDALFSSI